MKTASCFAACVAVVSLAMTPIVAIAATKPVAAAAKPPAGPPEPTGSSHTLTLTNGDPAAISSIYAAITGTENWTDDLLGKQMAGAGKTVTLKIAGPPEQCRYDLQLLMNDGKAVQKNGLDVCASPTYQFAR